MSLAGAAVDPPETSPVRPPAPEEPDAAAPEMTPGLLPPLPAVPSPAPEPLTGANSFPPAPLPERPNLSTSRLARFGVATVVFGFFLFGIGVFPEIIRLSITPGIGLLQILVLLLGVTVMTLGAYIYAYATRHRAQPRRLREDIGLRLMATGLVIAYGAGFADVLGIGSHFGAERPLLGLLQASGIALGLLVTIVGILLYARR
jgi:hypothetical protein